MLYALFGYLGLRAVIVYARELSNVALRNILENGLDRLEDNDKSAELALPDHENIRGSGYYH